MVRRPLRLLSYLLSLAVLGVVLWRLHLPEMGSKVVGMNWPLLVLAAGAGVAAVCLQAFRWHYLLQPPRLRYRLVLQATYLGSLVNALLPLRSGEVVRGVVVANRTGRPFGSVLATEVIERLSDALAMLVLVSIAVHDLPLPPGLRAARIALEVVVALIVGSAAVLALREQWLRRRLVSWRPRGRVGSQVRRVSLDLSSGIHLLRDGKVLVVTGLSALGMVALQVTMLYLALHAYHLDLRFGQAAAVVAVISIGTALPSMPSNVGSWQLSCVLGLSLFAVPAATAAGFSVVAFAVLSLVQLCGGVIALATSPFNLSQLRHGHRGEAALSSALERAAEAEA